MSLFRSSVRLAPSATKAALDASKLTITRKTGDPTPMPPLNSLVFGGFFSDHMLEVDWTATEGWKTPQIVPFKNLSIHPASSCLHYAIECFEGMKAYRHADGSIILFRPDMNLERMRGSCRRVALPDFDAGELIKCVEQLLKVDYNFIPVVDDFSLYIRPTAISTQPSLGVSSPKFAKLFVILSPVGPYYPEGFKPVSLLADPRYVRAWKGGAGNFKVGSNYAPAIAPTQECLDANYQQLLWIVPEGDDFKITEVGTMNLFVYWINEKGEKELVTAPVGDELVLPGVTRDSVLQLAREKGQVKVTERALMMRSDLVKAFKENRVIEIFGTGTAAVISPVERLGFEGVDYKVPLDPNDPSAGAGPLAVELLQKLTDIHRGNTSHKWQHIIKV